MAELIVGQKNSSTDSMLTREKLESIRFIQNVSGAEYMLKDLGKKGITLVPNQILDLQKFFNKKELGASAHLEYAINSRHFRIIDWVQLEESEGGGIKLLNVLSDNEKYEPRGNSIPKNVPIEDKKPNTFDAKLDEAEAREEEEDQESKPGRRKRSTSDED